MDKVDKLASDAMIWMNSKMNQQSKQNLTLEPAVKVTEIQAKIKVAMMACWPTIGPLRTESFGLPTYRGHCTSAP